jgi:transcriptional regulator with XRE-family HTH domain
MPATDVGTFDFSPEAIRQRREAVGLSREALAVCLVRSARTIGAWEAGERSPGRTVRPALLVALQLVPSPIDDARSAAAAVVERLPVITDAKVRARVEALLGGSTGENIALGGDAA